MATVDDEHYLRASLLLLKGTHFTARKVLAREEQKEINNSGRNLDDMLQVHKRKLECQFRSQSQKQKLFPDNGKTNVENWDISLLTGVLLEVFPNSLSGEERRAVRSIKDQRNKMFAHRATEAMSLTYFDHVTEILTSAFDNLVSEFGSETKEQCKVIKESCLKGPLDIKSVIESIKSIHDTNDMFCKILKNNEATAERMSNNVKTALADGNNVLKNQILTSKTEICEAIIKTQLTRSELTEIVEDAVSQSLQGKKYVRKVQVIESEIEVIGKEVDEEKIDLAEQIITTVINEAIQRKQTSDLLDIREIIQQILDEISSKTGVKALEAVTACVVIKFEPATYEQLWKLLWFLKTDEIKQRLSTLSVLICRHLGIDEQLRLSISLSSRTLLSIIDALETDSETKCRRSVKIPIQLDTVEGMAHVLNLFENGGLTNSLKTLSESVSAKIGTKIYLKSSVNVHQFKAALENLGVATVRKEEQIDNSEARRVNLRKTFKTHSKKMSLSRPLGSLQKPQWFIQLDNSKLRVNEDVLKDLKALASHLLVISIAGSYRTGKSWILSHLAGCDARNGFATADGQSAVTSGIWILCQQHPNKENCVVVFLDNEGLHDPFKNDTASDDNRLFILSFLLSDIFIFNAMQKFDNNDLEKIGFITMISKKLQKTDAQKSFPEFLLLLRDVSRVKVLGKQVQPAEYLEDVLNSCDDDDDDRFSPKWCIRKYCQKRKCFTLTQPVEFEDLADLGQMEEPALRSRFLDDVKKLKNHLFTKSDIKKFTNGSPYTASAFCAYVVALKENVEDGVIPKITSLQERILDDENARVWDETVKRFSAAIRNDENSDLYGRFNERFGELQRQGIEHLQHHLVPKTEDHRDETIRQFKELTDEEYLKVSAEKSRDFLVGSLEPYFLKVDESLYKAPNAKEMFEGDVMKVKEKYEKKKDLGPEKVNIWTEVEKIIKRKCKELELVDLRHQLQETDRANVEEKKRLEQLVRKIESDINEQNIEMRKKERELEQKKAQAEFEIDQKMKKAEAELDRQKKDLITDIQTMQETMVETITEERQQQIESDNDANILCSFLDGVAKVGATAISALKK